jgi:CII-binding regulator of phage lambda lysogenization HflD
MELLLLLITLRSEILSLLLRHPTETELIFGTHKIIHSKIKLLHQAFKCASSGAERMELTDCSLVVLIMKSMLTSNTRINKLKKTNLEKFLRKSSLWM